MFARLTFAAALALTGAQPALADPVSERPEAVAVTIYRAGRMNTERLYENADDGYEGTGLALITETRVVDLPAGVSKVSFRGVADGIVPQTAAIEGLPGPLIERNQDYDLLSPGSLLEKSIGKTVRLVRTDRKTGAVSEEAAIVRSGPNGAVLQTATGVEALHCSGGPERLVFDELPEGLADKPTLSVMTRTPAAGRYTVRLSYLAVGFTWTADYVARIRPDGKSLDLSAWVTLVNRSDTSLANAPTAVVAGNLSRDEDTEATKAEAAGFNAKCWPWGTTHRSRSWRLAGMLGGIQNTPVSTAGYESYDSASAVMEVVVTASRVTRQEELGDYKLYILPEPTTVAAHQTKQVLMLQEEAVPFQRVYSLRLDDDPAGEEDEPLVLSPKILLRLSNKVGDGLGKPLPAGTVSVMEAGSGGRQVLAGQKVIEDVAVGMPLDIEIGEAMDVEVTPRLVRERDRRAAGGTHWVRDIEVGFTNNKPVAIVLEYRQPQASGGQRVTASDHRHGDKHGDALWTFRLKPGESARLTYTVEETD